MSRLHELLWPLQQQRSDQEFSLPTFVWMSAVMPLHDIYTMMLQDGVRKGYSEITNQVPSGSTSPEIRV